MQLKMKQINVVVISLCKNQLLSFFCVGLLQLIVDSVVMFALVKFGVYVGFANFLSRAFAAVLGCYLNYSITFKRNKKSTLLITYIKFVLFWLFMTCLSSALMVYLSMLFLSVINENGLYLVFIKVAVEALLFFVSFFISKTIVFRSRYGS